MPLDPQIAAVLNAAPGGMSLPMGDNPGEARDVFEKICAATARYGGEVVVATTEDIRIPVEHGALSARVYRPRESADGSTPTLVFLHGGGFVVGSVESHDMQARLLCRDAGVTVLSVEYRLAPEHRFPAGLEDCVAAATWAANNIDRLGGDATRLAIGGDSAGGNLSAVTAHLLRGSEVKLAAQLLIYPATHFAGDYPSRTENAEGYFLTGDVMGWFGLNYLPSVEAVEDPRISPLLHSDLSGLPPAVVATAQYDPLRDEGDAYAASLAAAGVPVIHRCFDGMIHGFFGWGPISEAAAAANKQICDDLRSLLVT